MAGLAKLHVSRRALQWLLPLVAILLPGPLLGWLFEPVRGAAGGEDVTVLWNASPVMAVGVVVLGIVVAAACGLGACRLAGSGTGLRCAGFIMGWLAWFSGDMSNVYAQAGSGAVWLSAAEGLVLTAVLSAVLLPVIRSASDELSGTGGDGSLSSLAGWVKTGLGEMARPASLAAFGVGLAAALAFAMAVAVSPLRGQALAGGVVGAFMGGTAAAVVSRQMGGASALSGWLAVIAASAVGPLVLLVMPGAGEIAGAAHTQDITRLGFLQPLDWACGLALGVDRGGVWAASLVKQSTAATGGAGRR